MYTAKEIKEFKKNIPTGVSYKMIADECESFVTKDIVKNFYGYRSTSDQAAVEIVKKTKVAIAKHNKKVEQAQKLMSIL